MRNLLSLLLLHVILVGSASAQDTTRVLFLGNSYTFFNDVPTMLAEMAASLGHVIEIGQNTPGSFSLQGHTNDNTSQELIQQGDWDFVVMQEQSQKASLPYENVQADFFPSVQTLVDEIRTHNDCAVPLLYMTWGRENGDSQNCGWWPPVCTYAGMQELLTERYLEAADMTDSWCAPIGMIWEDVLATTNINLYNPDGSHPSAAGSYLATSAFFVSIFGENPIDSDFSGTIGFNNSQTIDEAVWNVWQNQNSAWKQYDLLDVELFSQSTAEGSIVQVSTSLYIDSIWASNDTFDFVWQDGDIETLDFEGSTTLNLVVYHSCGSDFSISETLTSSGSFVSRIKGGIDFKVYPNPVRDALFIELKSDDFMRFVLRDSYGRKVQEWLISGNTTLDFSTIPPGFYRLESWDQNTPLSSRAILVE